MLTNSELMDFFRMDLIPYLEINLKRLYPKNNFRLKGDYYFYKPLNKEWSKWEVNDGTILNESLFNLLWEYAFDNPNMRLDLDPEEIIESYFFGLK